MAELLRIENLCKNFSGVQANNNISLSVEEGEILALLGENGAGKSTLMNCAYGLLQPDEGKVFWRGQEVSIPNSRSAVELGIGMVHQHFMLIPVLSVSENVALGLPSSKGLLLDLELVSEKLTAMGNDLGMQVDPSAIVWQLPIGGQQRVEILKALYRKVGLLILDEPTAVLTPQEVKDLFVVLHKLTKNGMGIIFISHKLEEVMSVSDRVVILRDGCVVGSVKTSETNPRELARLMVGREVVLDVEKPEHKPGPTALEVKDLCVIGDRGLPALNHVSFDLHEGEILGIAGVDGNGQLELEETLCGLRKQTSGIITLLGQEVECNRPDVVNAKGLAHIPSDRYDRGMAASLSIEENVVASQIDRAPFSHNSQLNLKAIREFSDQTIKTFDVRTPSRLVSMGSLSGGNQQRVVLGSALSHPHKILIASQPTRGLDVGVTQQVYKKLIEERSKGTAILLISTELQEILTLSDRIAVLYRGEIMGIIDAGSVDIGNIGLMMAGVKENSEHE